MLMKQEPRGYGPIPVMEDPGSHEERAILFQGGSVEIAKIGKQDHYVFTTGCTRFMDHTLMGLFEQLQRYVSNRFKDQAKAIARNKRQQRANDILAGKDEAEQEAEIADEDQSDTPDPTA